MIIHDVVQGSPEWLRLRIGKVTGSNVYRIMGSKTIREGYLYELLAERLTGQATEKYVTDAMRNGTELEPVARTVYEMRTGCKAELVGFISDGMRGYSPDFITMQGDAKKLGEIKCPTAKTYAKWLTLDNGDIPKDHIDQVIYGMHMTGATFADFVAFNPHFGDRDMWISHVIESEWMDHSKKIMSAIDLFEEELTSLVNKITGGKYVK